MDAERYILFQLEPTTGPHVEDFRFGPAAAPGPKRAKVEAANLTPAELLDVRRQPGNLAAAEPLPTQLIRPVATAASASAPTPGTAWGVEAVGALTSPTTGKGVKVAVLDTGIDASHEAFRGLTITQRDFTGEGDGDGDGHGTHCAGTIAGREVNGFRIGVATGVTELLVGKVLGKDGGTTEALARGLQWALDEGATVISMSLSIDFPSLVERLTERGMPSRQATSRALEAYRNNLRLFDSIASVIQANNDLGRPAIVVCATGNDSARTAARPYTIAVAPPAASNGFVAVAALARQSGDGFAVADFSNTGASVAAPGVDIVSAKAGGGYTTMNGTSMAAPHVAGVAALWAERLLQTTGEINARILVARLEGSCVYLPTFAPSDVGAGLVHAPTA